METLPCHLCLSYTRHLKLSRSVYYFETGCKLITSLVFQFKGSKDASGGQKLYLLSVTRKQQQQNQIPNCCNDIFCIGMLKCIMYNVIIAKLNVLLRHKSISYLNYLKQRCQYSKQPKEMEMNEMYQTNLIMNKIIHRLSNRTKVHVLKIVSKLTLLLVHRKNDIFSR